MPQRGWLRGPAVAAVVVLVGQAGSLFFPKVGVTLEECWSCPGSPAVCGRVGAGLEGHLLGQVHRGSPGWGRWY